MKIFLPLGMEKKIEQIATVVAQYFGCSEKDIWGPSRIQNLAGARTVLYSLLYTKVGLSGIKLAQLFSRTCRNSYYHLEKYEKMRNTQTIGPTLVTLELEVDKIIHANGR